MDPKSDHTPLVAIVGQTASGKSALALELAKRWGGEIIAADSRTVYRGMDIGTAKPTAADQARVQHHLIDIYNPDERCTASDFKYLADKAVVEITDRGNVPFLVGGTGLYVDAVLFNFSFRGEPDVTRRLELERMPIEDLQTILQSEGIPLPSNEMNPRHLIRAIETAGAPSKRFGLRDATTIIGLEVEKEVLVSRIAARVDAMFMAGLEQEVAELVERYGWDCTPMQTIGYQEFQPHFAGRMTIQEVRQAIITHSVQYAKRQKTWFKRNKSIKWISKTEEAVELLTTIMNK